MGSKNLVNKKIEGELDKKLGEIKTKSSEISQREIADKSGLTFSNLTTYPISDEAIELIGENEAKKGWLAVVGKIDLRIIIAVLDPNKSETNSVISSLRERGFDVKIIITSKQGLKKAWSRYNQPKRAGKVELGAVKINESDLLSLQEQINNIEDLKNKVKNISATKVLEIITAGALKTEASDIHLEPEEKSTKIRYRFDGLLHDISNISYPYYEKVLNRVKLLSHIKLNIHDKPQDGRFTIKIKALSIEARVSILPSEYGETIVIRLLDPRTIKKDLQDLGIRPDLLETIKEQLGKPTGAILTTGPTGSGKTTALYAFVNYINSPTTKIITIEDPIEYHLSGVSQTQVDNEKGYTFSNGLRAIVRQDPDVVLVGEIRDRETADIALHASLTGHLVLSTLHTNDASGAIPRLIDLGIKPQTIAPAINMALAQRLIRILCPLCKKKGKIPPGALERIKESLEPIRDRFKLPLVDPKLEVYFPGKCLECSNSGYKGRTAVFESFLVSKPLERLILKSPAISDIRDLAIKEGMITMLQDAYLKLLEGITSIEEIDRVII